MTIDNIIYNNIKKLIEDYGFTERICIDACGLGSCFFTNYRSGGTKHFKVKDVAEIADFFNVSIDYLCGLGNTRDNFFVKKPDIPKDDVKRLTASFKKLDAEGRIAVAEAINTALENMRAGKRRAQP